VEDLESNNRLHINYLKGKQKLKDLTEDHLVDKFTKNTDIRPSKPLPLGYDFNKAFKGKTVVSREEIINRHRNPQAIVFEQNNELDHQPRSIK